MESARSILHRSSIDQRRMLDDADKNTSSGNAFLSILFRLMSRTDANE